MLAVMAVGNAQTCFLSIFFFSKAAQTRKSQVIYIWEEHVDERRRDRTIAAPSRLTYVAELNYTITLYVYFGLITLNWIKHTSNMTETIVYMYVYLYILIYINLYTYIYLRKTQSMYIYLYNYIYIDRYKLLLNRLASYENNRLCFYSTFIGLPCLDLWPIVLYNNNYYCRPILP